MNHPALDHTKYRYLVPRLGSAYKELFIVGTKLRAQSVVSDMENEGWTPEETAENWRIPVEAVHEAIAYVHANEEYLEQERRRERQEAIAKGYLKPTPDDLLPG